MVTTSGSVAAGGGGIKRPGVITGVMDITTKKIAAITPKKSKRSR